VGYPDGTDLLAASARTAQEHGYVHHSLRASIIHAKIALEHRDLPTAAALITHGLELAVDRQRTSLELDLRALAAQRQLLAGRFDLAAAELRYELRSERSSSRPVDHAWLTARWRSISGTGDPTDLLARAWTAACTTNEAVSRAQVTAASLEHAWLHHTDTPLADEAADLLERMVDLGHPWLAGELAYWLWRFDRLDGAPAVSAEPYRRQIEGEWNEAADRWNRLGLPYERAVALADGDVDAQMSAIEILDSIGAHPMANRVREEIRQRTGRRIPRPRQSPAGPRGGLTERQHEVLTLLGERLSNAEIADRLFISTRTAEHHVAAVMTRLGAGTRSEAVDLASERGILRTEDCLNGSDALAPD
jgi:DNA-binding CsgD family transcriptional regulator